MRRVRCVLVVMLAVLCSGGPVQALTIDHTAIPAFDSLTQAQLDQVRASFNPFYGHTSHGSQLMTGLEMLASENYGLYEPPAITEDGGLDLGSPEWESTTRWYLNTHPATNLVMWSWCGQLSWYSTAEVNTYLSQMSQLEADYPDVLFVYMTGHLDGTGPTGTLETNNEQIRNYCAVNQKILYDFADIETYDPSGTAYPNGSDVCEWCTTWCRTHPCPDCGDCAHSHCFNCYQKGKALWTLLGALLGQTPPPDPDCGDYNQDGVKNGTDISLKYQDLLAATGNRVAAIRELMRWLRQCWF